jgi:hypothetical protein
VNRRVLRSFAVYSGSRLGLFAGVLVLLLLVGLRGILVPVIAFVVSGLVSYMVLNRQRTAFGAALEESITRRRAQTDQERDDHEDEQA